jgi:uncharacterized GH25 family protein
LNPRSVALLLGLLVGAYASLVTAHDFWLQPSEYWITPGALTPMTLQVGHGPFRQRSPIPARRITRFQAIAPEGTVVDLHEQLQLGQAAEDGDDRARLHLMDRDGSERYSRCAKSILQVGAVGAGPPGQVNKPVGLPLEIVPEANPYGVPRSASLPMRVIYAGHPLAGALVKLTDLNNDASPFEVHLTDHDGRANFTMPNAGSWLLNVIWTKVLPRSEYHAASFH